MMMSLIFVVRGLKDKVPDQQISYQILNELASYWRCWLVRVCPTVLSDVLVEVYLPGHVVAVR